MLAAGCSSVVSDEPDGYLRIELDVDSEVSEISSKGSDPAAFTLEILRDGRVVRTVSPVGSTLAPIALEAGAYTLSAYSEAFAAPAFDKPVYGGSASATVASGAETRASVACVQTNAGVRIGYTDNFKTNRTGYSTTVRQIQGALAFAGADARRTGYFFADEATFVVSADDLNYEYTMRLEAQKIYNVTVDDAYRPSGGLAVSIAVTTETAEEAVGIVIPSGKVDYLRPWERSRWRPMCWSTITTAGALQVRRMPAAASGYRRSSPRTRMPVLRETIICCSKERVLGLRFPDWIRRWLRPI